MDAVATVSADGLIRVFVTNRSVSEPAELSLAVAAASLRLTLSETLSIPPAGDRFTVNSATAQPVGMTAADGGDSHSPRTRHGRDGDPSGAVMVDPRILSG